MRIGASTATTVRTDAAAGDLCAFSKCFGATTAAENRLSSASLVLNAEFRSEQPSTYLETMNAKMQGRFQRTPSTSWPRCSHKTYPVAVAGRKHNPLKSCADIRRERAARDHPHAMPDVIGALDDLSKSIDEQIVRRDRNRPDDADRHVTLIKVRQTTSTAATDDRTVHGRLEYVKDLMSTDETSEESLKADEEVRSYMASADDDDDDDDSANDDDDRIGHRQQDKHHHHQPSSECKNLKKLIFAVKKITKHSNCSQGTQEYYYTIKVPCSYTFRLSANFRFLKIIASASATHL